MEVLNYGNKVALSELLCHVFLDEAAPVHSSTAGWGSSSSYTSMDTKDLFLSFFFASRRPVELQSGNL